MENKINKSKYVIEIVVAITVVCSTLISIKSCNIADQANLNSIKAINVAEESNEIANESLQTAKTQFLQINRPYITISLSKYDDGQYWKISQEDKAVKIELRYGIRNIGNVAAKNLKFPDKVSIGPHTKLENGAQILFEKTGPYSIGPGEEFFITATIVLGHGSASEAKKDFEYIISDNSKGVTYQISIDYANEVFESQKYRTYIMDRVHNNEAIMLKSEVVVLGEEI